MIEPSACLELATIVKLVDYDESMSDPFEEMPSSATTKRNRLVSVNSKSAANIYTPPSHNDESISSVAIYQRRESQPASSSSKSSTNSNRSAAATTTGVLLCAGTSKGNLLIWHLSTDASSPRLTRLRCDKLAELSQAHGKQEIDDLQTAAPDVLVSVGRDNRTHVWSLRTFKKIAEMAAYATHLNNDTNQRMKHARFAEAATSTSTTTATTGNSVTRRRLFTSFIPRVRGGGKDLSSYVVRWTCEIVSGGGGGGEDSAVKFAYKFECKRRIKNTIITTLQTSKDGACVCIGDYEGRILLLDANFVELTSFKRQHSSVITDLTFYHDCSLHEPVRLDQNKLVLSISIDRTLQCYKYVNTKMGDGDNSNQAAKRNVLCAAMGQLVCCSMSLLKFVSSLVVLVAIFCYFFLHSE